MMLMSLASCEDLDHSELLLISIKNIRPGRLAYIQLYASRPVPDG